MKYTKNQVLASGYLRGDGRIGVRNRLLIIYLSPGAKFCAEKICAHFSPSEAEVIGFNRRVDSPFTQMKLASYAAHPNVGAVLLVQCGDEAIEAAPILKAAGTKPIGHIVIQTTGLRAALATGSQLAAGLIEQMQLAPRADIHFSDLIIGAECGGSDSTSGLAANPVVGQTYNRLVDLGATVMFEEMYEAVGLKDVLISRCANEKAAQEIARTYDKFFAFSSDTNQFFITPGNMNGGLTTIEEKSMGAVVKSGTKPIQGVVKIGRKPPSPGLWMMDSMTDTSDGCGPYVSEDATSLLVYPTCGALITILTSGRGHLANIPIAPTIKITGNRNTALNLADDTDLDASPVIYGIKTIDQLSDELMELIIGVASGKQTKGEALGHRDGVINQELQFQAMDQGGISGG